MTVIVAAQTKDQGIVLAADRMVSVGSREHEHEQPKLWVSDQYAIGAAGNLRVAQVLKHYVKWPKYRPDEDTDWEKFCVTSIVPAIRKAAEGHGVMVDNSGHQYLSVELLIATGDRQALVSGDGCVFADNTGRGAIGSGCRQALGALGGTGPWTESDVINAARRAGETAQGVGGPISVVDTKTLTVRTLNDAEAA